MVSFALAYGLYKGVFDNYLAEIVGMSVNHLITIMITLFGGLIWQVLGIETLFIISAVLGLCNSAYASTIKTARASV